LLLTTYIETQKQNEDTMSNLIERIEKVKNVEELVKLTSFEIVKKSLISHLKNREYHKERNARITIILKKAKELGL